MGTQHQSLPLFQYQLIHLSCTTQMWIFLLTCSNVSMGLLSTKNMTAQGRQVELPETFHLKPHKQEENKVQHLRNQKHRKIHPGNAGLPPHHQRNQSCAVQVRTRRGETKCSLVVDTIPVVVLLYEIVSDPCLHQPHMQPGHVGLASLLAEGTAARKKSTEINYPQRLQVACNNGLPRCLNGGI